MDSPDDDEVVVKAKLERLAALLQISAICESICYIRLYPHHVSMYIVCIPFQRPKSLKCFVTSVVISESAEPSV